MVPPRSDRISRVPPYSRTKRLSTRTGLSPTLACLSRQFRFLTFGHWPGPRSLATTNGVSVDVLSSGYLDVSIHRVCFAKLCIHLTMAHDGPGFPIRKSTDQSLLTAPRSFSQCATSFIASQCQGIHQMPLRRLISASVSRTGTSPDAQLGSRYQAYDPQRASPATLPVRHRGRITSSPCQTSRRATLGL